MDIYTEILNLQKINLPGVLVTVIDKTGHGPQVPGAKMLITENKKTFGTIGGGALEYAAIEEYSKVLKLQKSYQKKYNLDENGKMCDGVETGMICGGDITLFYECLQTKPNVFIFGAGHVGQAVVYFLEKLDYCVNVIDSRKELDVSFNPDVNYVTANFLENITEIDIPENSFVVITTHSHDLDYKILKKLYETDRNPAYIGLIASKKKSDTIVQRLTEEFEGKLNLSILHSPIGLKLGGKTPADIGLSITSEIQALKYKVEGNKHASKNWKEIFGGKENEK